MASTALLKQRTKRQPTLRKAAPGAVAGICFALGVLGFFATMMGADYFDKMREVCKYSSYNPGDTMVFSSSSVAYNAVWLSLLSSASMLLVLLGVMFWYQQFSLQRMMVCSFIVAAAGFAPRLMLDDQRDTAKLNLLFLNPLPPVVLQRLEPRLQPAVVLASLPPELNAQLGLNPLRHFNIKLLVKPERICCDIVYEQHMSPEQRALIRDVFSKYLRRAMNQELLAAGNVARNINLPIQPDRLFRQYETAWLERIDRLGPAPQVTGTQSAK